MPLPSLIDSHCHLDFPEFADELDAIVQRARDAGVARMITISTRVAKFEAIRALLDRYECVFGTVGTHPMHAHEEADVTVADLVALAAHPKIVGLGEVGMDYHYDTTHLAEQRAGLKRHIAAARLTGLPVVIHSRDCDRDMQMLLEEEMKIGAFPAVVHCFTGGAEFARAAVDMGLYISFSGVLTYKKNDGLRAVAAGLPRDRVIVETDAPYLAPVPFRGKRNEPAYVEKTAASLAECWAMTPAQLAEQTSANVLRLFSRLPPLVGTAA